jgi:hypothetical protein
MSKVIILDVDQTLIDAIKKSKEKPNDKLCYIESKDYYVYLRPHVLSFIDSCFSITPYIILWSAGTESYIEDVTNFLQQSYVFYKVITMTTYQTTTKDVDLLLTDNIVNKALIVFVDDKIKRIKYTNDNVIVLEIPEFSYLKPDTCLIDMKNQLNILFSN